MKRLKIFSLFLSIMLLSPLYPNAKKKLYLSKVNVTQAVPANIKTSIINRIKLNVLEKYEDKYQIVSDSDVALMNQKAAQLQKQGCSDEVCMKQIAEAIDADEIIYGDVVQEDGKIRFSLTNILRDKKTLQMSAKSIVEVKFSEADYDHYAREATIKLLEPKYQIKAPTLVFQDKLDLKAIDLGKTGSGTLSVLDFKTDDSSVQNVVNFLKEQTREGDEYFNQKNYEAAIQKYENLLKIIEEKVLPEKRKKIAKYEETIVERLSNSTLMAEKEWIDYYDIELKKMQNWTPKDFMWFINNYEGVKKSLDSKGDRFKNKLILLRKGVTDRIDTLRRTQILYYEKIGDTLYQSNEFEKAFRKYEYISLIPQFMYDEKKKSEEEGRILKKKDTIRKTGENFVKNAVKTYFDQAEYLNLLDKREEALKSVKLAKDTLAGSIFSTQESVNFYDENGKIFGFKTLREECLSNKKKGSEYRYIENKCELIWSKHMGWMEWSKANSICQSISMRLPTIFELQEAYNSGTALAWQENGTYFWSSSPFGTGFYLIDVHNGKTDWGFRDDIGSVRCRR